jgi:hypothetical protein
MVSAETFKQYRDALSGMNEDNVAEVTAKLVQLGLGNQNMGPGIANQLPMGAGVVSSQRGPMAGNWGANMHTGPQGNYNTWGYGPFLGGAVPSA